MCVCVWKKNAKNHWKSIKIAIVYEHIQLSARARHKTTTYKIFKSIIVFIAVLFITTLPSFVAAAAPSLRHDISHIWNIIITQYHTLSHTTQTLYSTALCAAFDRSATYQILISIQIPFVVWIYGFFRWYLAIEFVVFEHFCQIIYLAGFELGRENMCATLL